MTKVLKRCIYLIFFVVFFVSACYIFKFDYDMYHTQKEAAILNELAVPESAIDSSTPKNEIDVPPNEKEKTPRMQQLETLQKKNADVIAWIEIPGTNINYPVVQGANNHYYLNHNYLKKYSVNGAVFLDKDYVWNPPSSNLLIYGHHTTFKDLLKYGKKSFYQKHPTIRLTTNQEDVPYEIIAVFQSKVYYQSEKNVFRYYYFIHAKNEQEYNDFVANSKKASLYDTGKTAQYGEQLLTLSTCSYHTKDGRFVIVAKKSSS